MNTSIGGDSFYSHSHVGSESLSATSNDLSSIHQESMPQNQIADPKPDLLGQTAAKVNNLAKGLSNFQVSLGDIERADERVNWEKGKTGERHLGHRIGDYHYQGEKRFGVEPGFEATKAWKPSDDKKLLNPEHKFHDLALNGIRDESTALGKLAKELNLPPDEDPVQFIWNSGDEAQRALKDHVMSKADKFNKLHFIKLDYDDPQAGKVMIPLERAKGNWLSKRIHQSGTADTPRGKNEGAVMEALANDIYLAFGVEGQKLSIIQAKYSDGSTKLLLDGTEVKGPNGEKFHTFEGQIHKGRLEQNSIVDKETGERYPLSVEDLARAGTAAKLLGDVDKLGSQGANMGYVLIKDENGVTRAKLMNIDPGKALPLKPNISQDDVNVKRYSGFLESIVNWLLSGIMDIAFRLVGSSDRMTKKDLNTDLSLDKSLPTLRDYLAKGYKNFTIFDDMTLAEKMKGFKEINNAWESGKIQSIFIEYKKAFSEGELDFSEELNAAQDRLAERMNYFKEVLGERLKLSDNELHVIDNLEKLTSPTFHEVKSSDGKRVTHLNHLHVEPKTRHEWNIQGEGDLRALVCQAKDAQDASAIVKNLSEYFKGALDGYLKSEGNTVRIEVGDTIPNFLSHGKFTEESILQHKEGLQATLRHPPLTHMRA